jgi:hypothetical protein
MCTIFAKLTTDNTTTVGSNYKELYDCKSDSITITNKITMIRPVVTYSSETWTLTAKEENLRIFERQILRKIFGHVNTDNIWRT